MTADEAAKRALKILSASTVEPVHDTPALDVSILLAHFLGIDRSRLMAHPELPLVDAERDFFTAINRRATGIPVAYLTGKKEFWGLEFRVTQSVLIPKPDTEILVERALAIADHSAMNGKIGEQPFRVLDVCTGSGCIAISLKKSKPDLDVTATDISREALEVAKKNANLHQVHIEFVEGDLRKNLPFPANGAAEGFRYDLVVSNPPYVPTVITQELLSDGRGEPTLALDGGTDGLDLVRALVDNIPGVLRRGGVFLVEIGEYNAEETAAYLEQKGFQDITIHRDLEGHNRVVEGTLS